MKKQLSSNIEELKTHMSIAKSVHHWNSLREIAKEEFTPGTITALDASGYISVVIPPTTKTPVKPQKL